MKPVTRKRAGQEARTAAARTSPTTPSPPETGVCNHGASTSAGTPSRSSAGAERRRPAPLAAVVQLQRDRAAARHRRDVHAVGTALDQQPGHGPHQVGVLAAGAGDEPGLGAHGVGHRPLRGCPPAPGPATARRGPARSPTARAAAHRSRRRRRPSPARRPPRPGAPRSPAAAGGPARGSPRSASRPRRTPTASPRACPSSSSPAGPARGRPPATAPRVGSCCGSAGGQPRSSGPSPAAASIAAASSRWPSSPLCEPAPIASSACERGVQPAASSAVACTGLFDDRGRIGRSTAPAANVTAPAASRTTSEPRCADSKKPERQTSTRTGLSGQPVAFSAGPRRPAARRRRPRRRGTGGPARRPARP